MRERLKELDIRITELADYLHISRPTIYRFIDNYESGKTRGIDKGVLNLFRYIESNPLIGKKNVIAYIIDNFSDESSDNRSSLIKSIIDFENGKSYFREKADFLQFVASSNELDELIPYLNESLSILTSAKIEEDSLNKIGKYILFRESVRNNKQLTDKEMIIVRQILEDY